MGYIQGNVQLICAIAVTLLAGCAASPSPSMSQYQIALLGIRDQWMAPCLTLPKREGSSVWHLQSDYNDLAYRASECISRRESLIEYLQPWIERAKVESSQ